MAETLTITIRRMASVHSGFQGLDGIRTGKDEIVPFEFEGGVHWNITKNAEIFAREFERYQKLERKIFRDKKIVKGEQLTDANREKICECRDAIDDLLDTEIQISGVLLIHKDEFRNKPASAEGKKGVNNIPISVATKLIPITKENPPA